ncbi:MAG: cytochrome c [Polyangiales bacterium]
MRVICVLTLLLSATAVFEMGCSKGGTPTTPGRADADRGKSLEAYDFPIGSTDVALGGQVYAEFCEGCHPGGQAGDGPKIAGLSESVSQMRFKVRNGGDDMPAFDSTKISDAQLEALMAYTVTLGAVDPSL